MRAGREIALANEKVKKNGPPTETGTAEAVPAAAKDTKRVCGLVMPISAIDGCDKAHWSDVREILDESIEAAGFEPNMVSNADDVGIIQKRIIENLYENPMVVCDVSGKNPNVMFELGLRLAFDKPTIIVKDDKTTYSFDTSPIEHLEYPRDLRFGRIREFKDKLADKILATHHKATAGHNYTTFLKHFGPFTVVKIEKREISGEEFIVEELKSIRRIVEKLDGAKPVGGVSTSLPWRFSLSLKDLPEDSIHQLFHSARHHPKVAIALVNVIGDNPVALEVRLEPSLDPKDAEAVHEALQTIRNRLKAGGPLDFKELVDLF
jgi:hypothetical protein